MLDKASLNNAFLHLIQRSWTQSLKAKFKLLHMYKSIHVFVFKRCCVCNHNKLTRHSCFQICFLEDNYSFWRIESLAYGAWSRQGLVWGPPTSWIRWPISSQLPLTLFILPVHLLSKMPWRLLSKNFCDRRNMEDIVRTYVLPSKFWHKTLQ